MYEDHLVFNEWGVLENQKKKFVISFRKVHKVRLSGGSNGQLKLARQMQQGCMWPAGFTQEKGQSMILGKGRGGSQRRGRSRTGRSFQKKQEAEKDWGGDLELVRRGANVEGVDQAFCQSSR